jgi:hypothetical protein
MEPGKELDRKFADLINYISLTTHLNTDGSFGSIPQYSTTWDGMRLVVDEMVGRGWWPKIEMTGEGWYAVNFWNWRTAEESQLVLYKSAPYSVIKSAIIILEKDKTLDK